ncbi:transposon protein, putative, CACTA, En/Spm sub-class [Panicum miliaceum]|uniref:Transposon protein, putative, CACTA, En/Spm sub-class n=1 Tax=Panicum miliaceum TaxID=4540 RepID=A0A3L6PTT3_PANMI|nr:transposon protein, putative, CACTA, En/Spm sub-class [Panicum miliaceum]
MALSKKMMTLRRVMSNPFPSRILLGPYNDDDNDFGGPSSPPPRAPSPSSLPRARSTPTPPASAKGKKQTSSLPPAGTPGPNKWKIIVKKIGPKKKLAYELTEELTQHVRKDVTDHFKPKVPEKRVPVDPVEAEKFYNCLSNIAERRVKLPSDFDRTLIKAHQRMRQSGKGVPS